MSEAVYCNTSNTYMVYISKYFDLLRSILTWQACYGLLKVFPFTIADIPTPFFQPERSVWSARYRIVLSIESARLTRHISCSLCVTDTVPPFQTVHASTYSSLPYPTWCIPNSRVGLGLTCQPAMRPTGQAKGLWSNTNWIQAGRAG